MNTQDTSKNTCAPTLIPGADLKREWLDMKPSTLLRKRSTQSPFDLHQWQSQAYKQLRDKLLVWLNVPTGAGKSTAIMVAQVSNLINNPTRKTIVAVPKTAIADNYIRDSVFRLPGGGSVDLRGMVGTNMCDDDGMDGSKTAALLEFLRAKPAASTLNPNDVRDRLFLCSHALLSLVYDQVRDTSEATSLFKNTTVVIDEAHHVMNNETEEEGGARDFVRNRLGELAHFLTNEVSRAGVWLVTATAFRGDGLSMVPAGDKAKFTQFSMTFEEHWRENLPEIQSYCYDFATYKPGMSDDVFRRIVKVYGRSKMIVFCGNSLHATTGGCKYESVKRLSEIIREEWGKDTEILDLVTDDHEREARKRRLKDHSGSIDVVFALRIMDEGMDWPEAQNAIDMSPLRSLNIAYQRFGRLTRNFKGKNHIRFISMISIPGGEEERDVRIQMCNEALSCLIGAMMLEDLAQSMRFGQKKADKKSGRKPTNWLAKAFPDADKLKDIRTKGWVELNTLYAEAKESGEPVSGERAIEVLREVLEDAGVTENLDKVTESLLNHSRYLMWRGNRASRGLGGASAKEIVEAGLKPFRFMEEMEGGWWYTSQACGVETCGEWKKLREDADERAWMEKFNESKKFKETMGSCNIKQNGNRTSIVTWQNNQRQLYRRNLLSKKRVDLLSSIEFSFELRRVGLDEWTRQYKIAKKKFDETGDCYESVLVSNHGIWQSNQRAEKNRSRLPKHKIAMLNSIGFKWKKHSFRPFRQAREFIRSLNINWAKFCELHKNGKMPSDIPSLPSQTYKNNGWKNGRDFFGTEIAYADCKEFAKYLRESNFSDYVRKNNGNLREAYKILRKTEKCPKHIPSQPERMIGNWPGWPTIWRDAYKKECKPWIFKSPSGDLYETFNLSSLARDCGLIPTSLSALSMNKISHHKNWTFVSGPKAI